MKQLMISDISPELLVALDAESSLRGTSLNRTVLDLLHQALGLTPNVGYANGLEKLAGTWTEDEFIEFEKNISDFKYFDQELWPR